MQLEEESKRKEAQLAEISKNHLDKDKEYQELRKKLGDKLKQTQAEEARYLEMAAQFERELMSVRQELEVKTSQLDEVKRSAQEINSSRCIQLACAQEEVNNLKDELNGLLRKHRALNAEVITLRNFLKFINIMTYFSRMKNFTPNVPQCSPRSPLWKKGVIC